MLGLDFPALKSYAECSAVDLQEVGCLSEIHPPFRFLPVGSVANDLVVGTQGCDPLFCPPVTTACPQTVAGENAGDHFIRTSACQNPHCFHKILWRLFTILTSTPAAYLQLSVDSAFPVNDQNDCTLVRIYICDDFVNQGSHKPFFSAEHCCGGYSKPFPDHWPGARNTLLWVELMPPVDDCADLSSVLCLANVGAPHSIAVLTRRQPGDFLGLSNHIVSVHGERRSVLPPVLVPTPAVLGRPAGSVLPPP